MPGGRWKERRKSKRRDPRRLLRRADLHFSLSIKVKKRQAAIAAHARARALSPERRAQISRLGWEGLQRRRAAQLIEQVLFTEGGLVALLQGEGEGIRNT